MTAPTKRELTNVSTADLLKAFAKCTQQAGEALITGSKILCELERRGEKVGLLARGLFRQYRLLASGALDAEAASMLGGMQFALPFIATLPPKEQREIASGIKKIQVAAHDSSGKVVIVERPITQMSQREVVGAFNDTGLRPLAEQKRIVASREVDRRRSKSALAIRPDAATEELIIGQLRVPVSELVAPLLALGFKLTRVPK